MAGSVYLARCTGGRLAPGALGELFRAADLGECVGEGAFVALKLHFGEPGNTNVFKPAQCREIADAVRGEGGRPFLTDANVLYRSKRHNAVGHLEVAASNGFSYESAGAPLIIADGLRGDNSVEMSVPGGSHYSKARIAGAIARADSVMVLTHVTGHGGFGLGGAMKNLGMGSGSIAGKQMMHEHFRPTVSERTCIACGECARHCPVDAIAVPEGAKARVDLEKCIGCGECAAHCPTGAIAVQWGDSAGLQERTVEFCAAIMAGRAERFGFISLLTAVTGGCDCMGNPGEPIVDDIGAIAGRDIVAVDQAATDLVGADHLAEATPGARLGLAVDVAERMGLGTREYELVEL